MSLPDNSSQAVTSGLHCWALVVRKPGKKRSWVLSWEVRLRSLEMSPHKKDLRKMPRQPRTHILPRESRSNHSIGCSHEVSCPLNSGMPFQPNGHFKQTNFQFPFSLPTGPRDFIPFHFLSKAATVPSVEVSCRSRTQCPPISPFSTAPLSTKDACRST